MFIGKLIERCEGKLSVPPTTPTPTPLPEHSGCISNREETGVMGLTVQATFCA